MAKRGISLNPGADATLVTAATRAAMANAPKDLTKMFEAQTENYRKTMASVGESYGEIIKTVVGVAKPFVQEQIYNQKMKNLGRDLHSRGLGVKFEERLNKLRDAKKATFGMRGSERRNARRDIKAEQEKLFADIQITEDGMHNLSEQIASENYSKEGTSLFNQVQAQGIANGNNPIGGEGLFKGFKSVPTTNADGDRGWQLQNANGDVVSSIAQDGTVTLASEGAEGSFVGNSKIGTLLQGKVSLETETSLNALTSKALKDKVSLNGTKPSIMREIDGFVTEGNISALQHKTLGNNPRTFMDDLHSESKLSVEMFNALKGIKGLKDVPGTEPGIDKADFANAENMKILNDAMTPGSDNYDYETAKNAFNSWYADSVINSSNLSENLKKKEEGHFPHIAKGKSLKLGGIDVEKGSLESYYNDIEAGNEFKIGDHTYTPSFGGWEKTNSVGDIVGRYDNTAEMLKNGLEGGRDVGFDGIKQFEENTEGVFVNKETSDGILDLFGTGKTEEDAVSNLNILFKDEPLLDGMFKDPAGMGEIIKFNGKKYDVEDGRDAFELRKDINEYLKENKETEQEVAEQQGGGPTTAATTADPNATTAVVDTSDQNVVTQPVVEPVTEQVTTQQAATNTDNQYTEEELSAANPFNESVNEQTGLPNEGSVASTYSEYRGRGVERGPKTTFEFSESFVKAVGNDEKAIQRYIKQNPNVYPGVEIITEGVKGNDAFIVRVNGKEKKFQADPKMKVNYGVGSNDQRRASEIHDWIKSNSGEGNEAIASEIKAPVNNTEQKVVEKVVDNNPVLNAAANENTSNTNPVDWLKNSGFIGTNESQSDTTLVNTVNNVFNELLGEASETSKLPLTSNDKAWCGALVYEVLTSTNAIKDLETSGGKKSSETAYNFLRAKEYLKIGEEATEPKIGDVMVTSRSVGFKTFYHVGFYGGTDADGNVLQLGGNQKNKLSYRTIPKGQKVEGYRRLNNMADVKEATVVEEKVKEKASEAPNLG